MKTGWSEGTRLSPPPLAGVGCTVRRNLSPRPELLRTHAKKGTITGCDQCGQYTGMDDGRKEGDPPGTWDLASGRYCPDGTARLRASQRRLEEPSGD